MKRFLCLILIFGFALAIEASPEALALFEAKSYVNDSGDTLLYRILSPQDPRLGKTYPLVLFLHGAGERGSDNGRQLIWGAGAFINGKNLKKYPCYVLAPQCPEGKRWLEVHWGLDAHEMPPQSSETLSLVIELLETLRTDAAVDPRRFYVTGLSMGGYGTWDIISRMPETFAAAVPICGGGDEKQAAKLVSMPIWVFHGDEDTSVPVARSRNMVNAIRDAGGKKIRYTEYPGVGHGSWKPAYADPKLIKWMFRQKKSK